MAAEQEVRWVSFCRRTEDPKLAYIERQLTERGIPHRRNGHTFHAPLLQVLEQDHERASALLSEEVDVDDLLVVFDDIPDHDSLFQLANDGVPYEPQDWLGPDPCPYATDLDACTVDCDHEVNVHWTARSTRQAHADGLI